MTETIVHHRVGTITLSGLLFSYSISEGTEIAYEDAVELIQIGSEITAGKQVGALVDIKSSFTITKDAREYFALHANQKQFKAIAILSGNLASRLIANFYIRINRPEIPTRLFLDEVQALKWLRGYVNL